MHSVKTRCQSQVCSIIHDQFDRVLNPAFKFLSVIQHLTGIPGLVAILDQAHPGTYEILSSTEHGLIFAEGGRIEDGVQLWDVNHALMKTRPSKGGPHLNAFPCRPSPGIAQ